MSITPPVLAPSLLAANYARIEEQINICNQSGIEWMHFDIMDGSFVPNISFGPKFVSDAAALTGALIDVHLMIDNPDYFIDHFAEAGARLITVHSEATRHLHRAIQNIKKHPVKAGVAVNPATPLHNIEPVLHDLDLVLIMSVNPGFGGQHFIPHTHERLQQMVTMRNEKNLEFLIQVDGGVNTDNIHKIVQSGADVLVAGSSVFKADDISERIETLRQKAHSEEKVV